MEGPRNPRRRDWGHPISVPAFEPWTCRIWVSSAGYCAASLDRRTVRDGSARQSVCERIDTGRAWLSRIVIYGVAKICVGGNHSWDISWWSFELCTALNPKCDRCNWPRQRDAFPGWQKAAATVLATCANLCFAWSYFLHDVSSLEMSSSQNPRSV